MKKKAKIYLQLMRFPNTFTAMADVLAGYLIVSGGLQMDWPRLAGLIVATTCIYGAGCVLNDIHDRELDALERPTRPIPSGMISVREASVFTGCLYGMGLLSCFIVGWCTFGIALVLVGCTISYDLLIKDVKIIGPLNMASCRSLNLILGMSLGIGTVSNVWIFALITLGYVFYLTMLSQFEVNGNIRNTRRAFIWGGILVLVSVIGMELHQPHLIDGIVFSIFCFLFILPPVFTGLSSMKAEFIGRAVKYLIIGIPLLDAIYVSGRHGWLMGIPVALCIVPALVVGRYFYST